MWIICLFNTRLSAGRWFHVKLINDNPHYNYKHVNYFVNP